MKFPLDLADENACYQKLLEFFHPHGFRCPHCGQPAIVHRRHQLRIIVDYLCKKCRRVFNVWTGTPLQKTRHSPSQIMRLIIGIHDGKSTRQLAREFGCDRSALHHLRHRLEPWVTKMLGRPRHTKKKRTLPTPPRKKRRKTPTITNPTIWQKIAPMSKETLIAKIGRLNFFVKPLFVLTERFALEFSANDETLSTRKGGCGQLKLVYSRACSHFSNPAEATVPTTASRFPFDYRRDC